MLGQLGLDGRDRVQVAIERLKTFEPPEGYYLAYSGGKDSICIKRLADMAGVRYDAHYNVTSVDPPELVWFVREQTDVVFDRPIDKDGRQVTMWNLIPRKMMPPTRIARYCCELLKESRSAGRFTVTGVRREESVKRRGRAGLEFGAGKWHGGYDPDNPNQELIHQCMQQSKRILNPIIDWDTSDVWAFIRAGKLPYPSLYDNGYTRLGCIGCPMSSKREHDLERYPKFKVAYLRAFGRMLENRKNKVLEKNDWRTPEDVMRWWLDKREGRS